MCLCIPSKKSPQKYTVSVQVKSWVFVYLYLVIFIQLRFIIFSIKKKKVSKKSIYKVCLFMQVKRIEVVISSYNDTIFATQ